MTEDARLLELAARLRQMAGDVEFPPTPPLRAAVIARLRAAGPAAAAPAPARMGARRRLALAAALLATLLGASLALPPWRHAVAGWLRLPGVTVERTASPPAVPSPTPPPSSRPGTPPPPGALLGLGEPATLEAATARLGFRPLLPASLGAPDAVWMRTQPGAGAVTLVYAGGPGRPPPDAATHVSVLVTELRGDLAPEFLAKFLGPGAVADAVGVGADQGLWITGSPHAIAVRTGPGVIDSDSLRLAGNTLVWQHGPLLLRVEGAATLEQAQAIAASMGT